eukprot:12443392-Alexandrium_andersonii.AAC.1
MVSHILGTPCAHLDSTLAVVAERSVFIHTGAGQGMVRKGERQEQDAGTDRHERPCCSSLVCLATVACSVTVLGK